MSRQAQHATTPVSLFPFLAVLVCATGALIFLLLVTTRRMRLQAIARACEIQVDLQEPAPAPLSPNGPAMPDLQAVPSSSPEEPEEHDGDSHDPLDTAAGSFAAEDVDDRQPVTVPDLARTEENPQPDWETLVAGLEEQQAERLRQLEEQQRTLETAAEKLQKREESLAETKQRLGALRTQKTQKTVIAGLLREQQAEAKSQIAKTRQRIAQMRQQNAQAPSKFAIVPYEGNSGTTRRPIYIECTEDWVRFLPEDIALTRNDLMDFDARYNPLLAGARALIHYWSARNHMERNPETEPEPYVLLLVRPSGSVAFWVAREFLSDLGDSYGYELIDDDWTLELPPPDPEAQTVCREAIEAVLAERKRLVALLEQRDGPRTRSGTGAGTAASERNRFDLDDLEPPSRGRGGGGRSGPGDNEPFRPPGNDGWIPSQRFFDSPEFQKRAGGPANRYEGDQRDGSHESHPSGDRTANPHLAQPGTQPGTQPRTQPGTQPGTRGDAARMAEPPMRPLGTGELAGQATSGTPSLDGGAQPGLIRREAVSGSRALEPLTSRKPLGSDGGAASQRFYDSPEFREHAKGPTGGSEREQRDGSRGSQSDTDREDSAPFSRSGSQGDASGSKSAETSAPDGRAQSAPAGQDTMSGQPSLTLSKRKNSAFERPLIPKRWGLSSPDASIGLERQVVAHVRYDGIAVGHRHVVLLEPNEPAAGQVRRVVEMLDEEACTWGKPPRGFYWTPAIRFVVHQGGNGLYERLNSRFSKAGLSTSVTFALDDSESSRKPN